MTGYTTLWMVAVPSSEGRTYSDDVGIFGGTGQLMSERT
jgi:hypothetical protein